MARLIPRIDPTEIENSGERLIATALVEQLPKAVEVFHSLKWLEGRKGEPVREGESDFTIVYPGKGILYLEVKGGSIRFDPLRDEWQREYRDGRRENLKRSPFDQVRESMHALDNRIRLHCPELGTRVVSGYAVAFPDSAYDGPLPADVMREMIIDAVECSDLKHAIDRVFRRWRGTSAPGLDVSDVRRVHEALLPEYGLTPVLWRRIEDEEDKLVRLTEIQQCILDSLSKQRVLSIEGVAGSGKTLLAISRAQQLAKSGKRTLLLCYNLLLAEWIASAVEEVPEGLLKVSNFHGLAAELCNEADIEFVPGDARKTDPDFWNYSAPQKMSEALSRIGHEEKFDAVIIDEAQDFRELWWTAVEDLFRVPEDVRIMIAFSDPNQNIYLDRTHIQGIFGDPVLLSINCRNTVRIAEHCAGLVGQCHESRLGAPEGVEPEFLHAPTLKEAFRKAGKTVRKWCKPGSGGLNVSQVAVLAPTEVKGSAPKSFGTVKIVRNLKDWRSGKGVLLDSWKRFKGLEADAVVIVEAPTEHDIPDKLPANRYVARSRAKHLLTVIEVLN